MLGAVGLPWRLEGICKWQILSWLRGECLWGTPAVTVCKGCASGLLVGQLVSLWASTPGSSCPNRAEGVRLFLLGWVGEGNQ